MDFATSVRPYFSSPIDRVHLTECAYLRTCCLVGYQEHKRYYNDHTQEDIHSTREIGIDGEPPSAGTLCVKEAKFLCFLCFQHGLRMAVSLPVAFYSTTLDGLLTKSYLVLCSRLQSSRLGNFARWPLRRTSHSARAMSSWYAAATLLGTIICQKRNVQRARSSRSHRRSGSSHRKKPCASCGRATSWQ